MKGEQGAGFLCLTHLFPCRAFLLRDWPSTLQLFDQSSGSNWCECAACIMRTPTHKWVRWVSLVTRFEVTLFIHCSRHLEIHYSTKRTFWKDAVVTQTISENSFQWLQNVYHHVSNRTNRSLHWMSFGCVVQVYQKNHPERVLMLSSIKNTNKSKVLKTKRSICFMRWRQTVDADSPHGNVTFREGFLS